MKETEVFETKTVGSHHCAKGRKAEHKPIPIFTDNQAVTEGIEGIEKIDALANEGTDKPFLRRIPSYGTIAKHSNSRMVGKLSRTRSD